MVVKVQDKKTKEIKTAVYGPNRLGHLRYHVFENDRDYKSVPDKEFDRKYKIIEQ